MKSASNSSADWNVLWNTAPTKLAMSGPSFRHKQRWVLKFLPRLGPGTSMLDVACGQGALLHAVQSRGWDRFGIDLSSTAVNQAKQLCPHATFAIHDIEQSPLPSTFDVITCTNALEEMKDDAKALRNMAEMLNPNGFLILVVPYRKAFWTTLDDLAGNQRRYELAELTQTLDHAGLAISKRVVWGWPLYALWYGAIKSVKQDEVLKTKRAAWLAQLMAKIAYLAFFLDDLFCGLQKGRILIVTARKKR